MEMIRALVICGIISTVAAILPSSWKPCSKSAPDHNECMKRNLEAALESMKNGIPELNIPKSEPFPIKHFDLAVSDDFQLIMDDGTVAGLTSSKVKNVESIPWKKLKVSLETPKTEYNFNYSASGVLFNIKIQSSGVGLLRTEGAVQEFELTFSEFQRDGKRYLKVDDIKVTEQVTGVYAEFHPQGRDTNYKSMINKIINENWKELMVEQRKNGYPAARKLFTSFINPILDKIPMEDFDKP